MYIRMYVCMKIRGFRHENESSYIVYCALYLGPPLSAFGAVELHRAQRSLELLAARIYAYGAPLLALSFLYSDPAWPVLPYSGVVIRSTAAILALANHSSHTDLI